MKNKFKKLINSKSRQYQDLFDEVEILMCQSRFNNALELLETIPEGHEDYPKALVKKSMIFGLNNEEKTSFKIFQKALALEFGEEYVDLNEEYKPVKVNDSLVLFHCGLIDMELFENYSDAIKNFDLSLKINPNQCDVLHQKARALLLLKKPKKALKVINKAIEINPKFNYWHDKAVILGELNHFKKAHKCFDNAIRLNPNPHSWTSKGLLYCDSDQFDKALECFDNAIKLDSRFILAIVYSGSIYSELKDFDMADKYFKWAEEIDKNDVIYLAERGKYFLNLNEFSKSIDYFERSLKIDENIAIVWMYKSMALSELGRDEESEICFNKAIELDPDSISVFDEVIVIED